MTQNKIFFLIGIMIIFYSCTREVITPVLLPGIPNSLQQNVIAFYPFSDGSIEDLSGNGHDLINTTNASPTSDRNENINCAYGFNNAVNSSEFLTTTNTEFLNDMNSFSISLWYQALDESRSPGRYESLINRGLGISCPDRNGQWSVGLFDCRKAVFARTNSVWDKDISSLGCEGEIATRTNRWTHLVATFSGTNEVIALYRNGVLQESKSGKGDCGTIIPEAFDFGDLYLGKKFTGKIDDLIIFNKALSQEEIDLLFEMEPCYIEAFE